MQETTPTQNKNTNQNTNQKPTLELDVALYQHYFDDSDMTEAQKNECLHTIWQIVCEFVRLGYGIHPLQHLLPETSGQLAQSDEETTALLVNIVNCKGEEPEHKREDT